MILRFLKNLILILPHLHLLAATFMQVIRKNVMQVFLVFVLQTQIFWESYSNNNVCLC